ncbi:MAG: cob(I)yrinic acid a,c-diamide adenosyltransferase [Acidobacteriia bacterium]|nr:cob(I)yrinic acid a,c-diamide adenosyltransferase [Terriglobia bacterium]
MSIATKTGDKGQTGLVGGARVSKSSLRVEAYGTVDELNSVLGLARSICPDPEVAELTKSIQKELFLVGAMLATTPEFRKKDHPTVTQEMVDGLTAHVHRIESIDGILADWTIPGEHRGSAAYDLGRTVCRRAERCIVRLAEAGEEPDQIVVAYINRLSDLLWLFGRLLELRAGVDAKLRDQEHEGPRWSKAW